MHDYLEQWSWDGFPSAKGKASPTGAIIIDAQTAKRAAKLGLRSILQGYDAGKKINGRKRHIRVDTLGLLLNVVVHPADVQDRYVLSTCCVARRLFPFIERVFVDAVTPGARWR